MPSPATWRSLRKATTGTWALRAIGVTARTELASSGPRISRAPSASAVCAAWVAPSGVPLVSCTSSSKSSSAKSKTAIWAALSRLLPSPDCGPLSGSSSATRGACAGAGGSIRPGTPPGWATPPSGCSIPGWLSSGASDGTGGRAPGAGADDWGAVWVAGPFSPCIQSGNWEDSQATSTITGPAAMARQRNVSRNAKVGHRAGPRLRMQKTRVSATSLATAPPRVNRPAAAPRGLVLVATPIGNAADITLRALSVLAGADVVACEDTRVTGKLLTLHGLKASLTPYHEHNAAKVRPALIRRLKDGESVALVSDAGTPLVSDPGYRLVRACLEEGIPVTAVPGASSVLTALQLSGLPSDRFLFAGFLPPKSAARRRALAEIAAVPATLIFLESAKRLDAALADMADMLGDREAAVARELTKMFEEVRRGPLADLARHYAEAGPPKGEVSVVVAPPGTGEEAGEETVERNCARRWPARSLRDAVDAVAAATGWPRRRVYACALALTGGQR
jgi:16S rRNA (cytidine1402-2'-O)-methyltransferase